MKFISGRKGWLTILLLLTALLQQAKAQKETFFHHFNWQSPSFTPAGTGAQGFAISSLYRNYNDSLNHFLALELPVHRLNSAIGFYYQHNSAAEKQRIESGLSYTGFIRLGQNSSLRLGLQGRRSELAYCEKTWAFGEYSRQSVYYAADASLFLQRDKLALGFSIQNILPKSLQNQRIYNLLLGFDELHTSSWLRSSPYLLMRMIPGRRLPEWRYQYTATIANFLQLGGNYYRNSSYLYGLHAGFKIANTVWLTGATDFVDTQLPYRAIYELGLRLNVGEKNKGQTPSADIPQSEVKRL